MKYRQFELAFENNLLDDQYAEFIMTHNNGDRIICNGDTLIAAIESEYLFDEFVSFMTNDVIIHAS
jgi:hypothetical protein